MIQKLTNKLNDRKKDNKGFTLVELIVVIVILAILAAILIPGLLKWIDKAKEEQYVLEARNVLLATEAELAQTYADNATSKPTSLTGDPLTRVATLSSVDVKTIASISYKGTGNTAADWDVTGMTITFNSSNGKGITAKLANGTWDITVGDAIS